MFRRPAFLPSIPGILVLAACGGAVTPDESGGHATGGTNASTTATGWTTSINSDVTAGSGTTVTGTSGTTLTGDTSGTSGTSGTASSGTAGSTATTYVGSVTTTSTTTGPSPTTGTCGSAGSGGAGGAGGASGSPDGGTSPFTTPHHEAGPAIDAPPTRVAPPGSAMLLRWADFPPPSLPDGSGTSGSSTVTTGGGPDPETQYLVFGDAPVSCGAPYGPGGCGHWRVLIGIPPNDFKPGTIVLDCANVNAYHSVSGTDRGGGDCSWGGGSFNHGVLEIFSIDAAGARVRLSGTWKFGFDADAVYDAPRCR